MAKKRVSKLNGAESRNEAIRILHLSDFHLSEERRWDQDDVLTGLASVVQKLVRADLSPDIVAITGDLADKGRAADYAEVRRWIENGLRKALPPRFPRRRIVMVPGNHDVDRTTVKAAAKALQSSLLAEESQETIASVLRDPNDRRILLNRHDHYLAFANQYRPASKQHDSPWWSDTLTIRGVKLCLLGLCSSWISFSNEDHGRLLVGSWQVKQLLPSVEKADYCIVLVHHPWSYVADFDATEVEQLIHQRAHLVLRGHLHRQQSRSWQDPNDCHLELAAGSVYAGSQYPNAFQLVELCPAEQIVRVHYWIWRDSRWIRDRTAYPSAPEGIATFELNPVQAKIDVAKERPLDTSKYLLALTDATSHIDIRGLQVGSGKATRLAINELYIPLTTSVAERAFVETERKPKKGKSSSESPDSFKYEHSPRVTLDEALKNDRLVIIGDPGSGKTTFLRRIAWILCRTLTAEDPKAAERDLGLNAELFPLFIRVGDFIEHIHNSRERSSGPSTTTSPAWITHYLTTFSAASGFGLDEPFYHSQICDRNSILLLDGLDEAPNQQDREMVVAIVGAAANAFRDCRFVLTSRPAAYSGNATLANFAQVQIDALEDDAIQQFLKRWCHALFPESTTKAQRHLQQLLHAVNHHPAIRRLARNPVMLTALAVVHWNEKRLPEQRADLYESIITWLARQRDLRPQRPAAERCITLLQSLALAMQVPTQGRQVQLPRYQAAQAIEDSWREVPEAQRHERATRFLQEEELDSGIIVSRGDDVRFWHLTFQEFLTARALAACSDDNQRDHLLLDDRLFSTEWKEVVLLLAGVLYHQGLPRVDRLVSTVLSPMDQDDSLTTAARCVGLLGSIQRDLSPVQYAVSDPAYDRAREKVMAIFDRDGSQAVPIEEAIQAADALDPEHHPRCDKTQEYWIPIQAGEFTMGAQSADPDGDNYDKEAQSDEGPVHKVHLDAYEISRFAVTVADFEQFVNEDGYKNESYWKEGGFGKWGLPGRWDDQLQFANRPVVYVSWYEAAAYAAWANAALPTEAQWERAARGKEARRYPWGKEDADTRRMNYATGKADDFASWKPTVGHPTSVGVYPLGTTPDGICDLAGNVWEWCSDWHAEYSAAEANNPTGPQKGKLRVLRGGAWHALPIVCRASYRNWGDPAARGDDFGFRLVRVVFAARTHSESL